MNSDINSGTQESIDKTKAFLDRKKRVEHDLTNIKKEENLITGELAGFVEPIVRRMLNNTLTTLATGVMENAYEIRRLDEKIKGESISSVAVVCNDCGNERIQGAYANIEVDLTCPKCRGTAKKIRFIKKCNDEKCD